MRHASHESACAGQKDTAVADLHHNTETVPSMASPTFERSEISEASELLSGPASLPQPITTELQQPVSAHVTTPVSPSPSPNLADLLGHEEATEDCPCSPSSPRSPQALASSPLPEFHQLTSPVALPETPTEFKVYSRRRHMRLHRPSLTHAPAVGVAVPRETPPTAAVCLTPSSPATTSVSQTGSTASKHSVAGVAVPQPTPPAAEAPLDAATLISSTTTAAGVAVPCETPPTTEAALAAIPTPTATMAVGVAVPRETPPAADMTPRTSARNAFIAKLARHTAGHLPVPTINKRCTKAMPLGQTPRRSRRLAGAQVEFKPDDLDRRSKKKVMRSLEIIGEQDGIDQQTQDDYAKIFGQPLSDLHLQALAALFKWSIPEDLDHANSGTVAT